MRNNNKGFSLVEMIIVIAIMAILVGIVGSRVLPYLNKSREAKDQQILSGWITAATSAYATNAVDLTDGSYDIVIDDSSVVVLGTNAGILKSDFVEFSGIQESNPFDLFGSGLYRNITQIKLTVTTEVLGNRNAVCICDIQGVDPGDIPTSELVVN